jgi:hypothetical protein
VEYLFFFCSFLFIVFKHDLNTNWGEKREKVFNNIFFQPIVYKKDKLLNIK